eukprot:1183148-Prorocentrum_minimum.AAC.1
MRATNRTTTTTENIPHGRPIERRWLRIFHADDQDDQDVNGDVDVDVAGMVVTVQVVERNSGRDPFPKLLSRARLPKQVYSIGARSVPSYAVLTPLSLLSYSSLTPLLLLSHSPLTPLSLLSYAYLTPLSLLLSHAYLTPLSLLLSHAYLTPLSLLSYASSRPMSDATRKRMDAMRQFYHFKDLRIGEVINVYNRAIMLHDCDSFTKKFYMEECGRAEKDFVPVPQ